MENNNQNERKKSVLSAITATRLTEMLKNIDISSIKESNGGYNARARIMALFDMGTFSETGAYMIRRDPEGDPDLSFEGVITGYGAIEGRLIYAFVQDNTRMKGAFDSVGADKIISLIEMAMRNGAPVVGIFDSRGASIYEGARVLAAYGRVMRAINAAKGIIPLVALIPGVCGGGMASMASAFDLVLCVRGMSEFYMVPGTEHEDAQRAAADTADIVAESEDELYLRARELFSYLPSNCNEGARCAETAVFEREPGEDIFDMHSYDAGRIVSFLADSESFAELRRESSEELLTCLTFIGGICCGVMANQPRVKGGCMSIAACRSATRLVKLCDSFCIPLITLVNTVGIDSSEKDQVGYASAVGELYTALATSENAKISAVVGNAYGMGFTLMASKSIGGDIAFATPNACISAMSPEASVAFVWNDRICDNNVTVTRDELESEWRQKLASPNDAAMSGQIDDIVEPYELRARVVSAVRMLSAKTRELPTLQRKEWRRK